MYEAAIEKTLSDLIYESEHHLPEPADKNGLPCLTFPSIDAIEGVSHLVSTRLGGFSQEHLGTLNLSFSRGDDSVLVRKNFAKVADALSIPVESITFTDQTHTANVRVVTEEDRGKGMAKERDYTDIDGLVTNVPGICLSAYFADCVPLLFVDPVKRAIGLSHSGWRGTVGKIGLHTVELMTKTYGTDPTDLIAAIGPSIGYAKYEVSEDVIDQFRKSFPEVEDGVLFYKKENGKYQLNLRKACELTMREAGIPREQISVATLCTASNPDLLFSHRVTGGMRGNLGAFLCLMPEQTSIS